MMKKTLVAALISLLSILPVSAQDDAIGEPKIVIKQMEDKVIHEYRINGFLYAIKVIPKKGKPYYLVAEDGNEYFIRVDEPRFLVPKWEIFSWK